MLICHIYKLQKFNHMASCIKLSFIEIEASFGSLQFARIIKLGLYDLLMFMNTYIFIFLFYLLILVSAKLGSVFLTFRYENVT